VTHGTEPAFWWLQVIYILLPQNEEVGRCLIAALPEMQRGSRLACRVTAEAKLARNHHPALNYSHPFANMPRLPRPGSSSPNNSLTASSPLARARRSSRRPRLRRAGAQQPLPLPRRGRDGPRRGAGARAKMRPRLSEWPEARPALRSCPCQIFHQQNRSQVPAHA